MHAAVQLVLKVALAAALLYAYVAPEDVLERGVHTFLPLLGDGVGASAALQDREAAVQALRTLLTLALSAASLLGAMSPGLIAVSCAHAALHFLSSRRTSSPLLLPPAVLESAVLASFLLLLRYVCFPPASTLASFQRHRTNLEGFFQRHDKKYVPYVHRLLEDHVGHERLLYARVRRLYQRRRSSILQ